MNFIKLLFGKTSTIFHIFLIYQKEFSHQIYPTVIVICNFHLRHFLPEHLHHQREVSSKEFQQILLLFQ